MIFLHDNGALIDFKNGRVDLGQTELNVEETYLGGQESQNHGCSRDTGNKVNTMDKIILRPHATYNIKTTTTNPLHCKT